MTCARVAVLASLALSLALWAPRAVATPPVIPQYGSTLPSSSGPQPVGQAKGAGGPGALPPEVEARLEGESEELLRAVGTSAALGAPASVRSPGRKDASDESPSFASSVTGAVGGAPALLLLLGMGAVSALLVFVSSRTSRGTER